MSFAQPTLESLVRSVCKVWCSHTPSLCGSLVTWSVLSPRSCLVLLHYLIMTSKMEYIILLLYAANMCSDKPIYDSFKVRNILDDANAMSHTRKIAALLFSSFCGGLQPSAAIVGPFGPTFVFSGAKKLLVENNFCREKNFR